MIAFESRTLSGTQLAPSLMVLNQRREAGPTDGCLEGALCSACQTFNLSVQILILAKSYQPFHRALQLPERAG